MEKGLGSLPPCAGLSSFSLTPSSVFSFSSFSSFFFSGGVISYQFTQLKKKVLSAITEGKLVKSVCF